jgi:peptidoglycan hydrolase-like protein with peptidoglycan-binding domain
MTRSRFLTAFLGLFLALGLTPVLAMNAAATTANAPAATPTCTSWSTHFADGTSDYVQHMPSAGRNTYVLSCVLRQGNRNDAVKVLQRSLRVCSGYNLAIDGDYGPLTRAAVLDLQQRMNGSYNAGLEEDGEYGPETFNWVKFPLFTDPGNVITNMCDHSPIP